MISVPGKCHSALRCHIVLTLQVQHIPHGTEWASVCVSEYDEPRSPIGAQGKRVPGTAGSICWNVGTLEVRFIASKRAVVSTITGEVKVLADLF